MFGNFSISNVIQVILGFDWFEVYNRRHHSRSHVESKLELSAFQMKPESPNPEPPVSKPLPKSVPESKLEGICIGYPVPEPKPPVPEPNPEPPVSKPLPKPVLEPNPEPPVNKQEPKLETFDIYEDVEGDLCIDVVGNVYGNVKGDIVGDVYGDVCGTVYGDVCGDVEGTVYGNVTGNIDGNVKGDICGDVEGTVYGNVTGNIYSSVTEPILETPMPEPKSETIPVPEPQPFVQYYKRVAMMSSNSVVELDDADADSWNVSYTFERDVDGNDKLTESYTTRKINLQCGTFEVICHTAFYEGEQRLIDSVPMPEPSNLTVNYQPVESLSAISYTSIEWENQDDIVETWQYSLDFERDINGQDTLIESFRRTSRDFEIGYEETLDSICKYESSIDISEDSCIAYCGDCNSPSLLKSKIG